MMGEGISSLPDSGSRRVGGGGAEVGWKMESWIKKMFKRQPTKLPDKQASILLQRWFLCQVLCPSVCGVAKSRQWLNIFAFPGSRLLLLAAASPLYV